MKQAGAYTSGLIYGGRPALLSPRLSAHGAVHAIKLWGVEWEGGGASEIEMNSTHVLLEIGIDCRS